MDWLLPICSCKYGLIFYSGKNGYNFSNLYSCVKKSTKYLWNSFQKGNFFSVPPYSGQVFFFPSPKSLTVSPFPLPPFPLLLRSVWIGRNILYGGFSAIHSFRRLLGVLEGIPADKGGLLPAIHPSDHDRTELIFYITAFFRENSHLTLDPPKLYNPVIRYVNRIGKISSNLILEDMRHPERNLAPRSHLSAFPSPPSHR